MAEPTYAPNSIMFGTVVDFAETTVAIETVGQLAGVGEITLAGAGEGILEPYFIHTEDGIVENTDALETDGIECVFPDVQQRWVHIKGEIDNVDAGTGAVEDEDFVDFGVTVNGVIVLRSEEGRLDAAETVVGSFTFDGVIPVEQGDVIQFVAIGAGDEDEEFTVTVEALEAQVFIAPK